MGDEPIRYELRDGVALLRMDDGKANALSPARIQGLNGLLDRSEAEAGAVLWLGRPGCFCAGFDLGVMRSGGEAMRGLVGAGAELFARLLVHPRPVVVACTGHALAAGALALLAADARLGARGDFKIGLNEVAIGMTLPLFAVELARLRVSKRHFARATAQAEIYAPDAAVDAGFLDRVLEPEALFDASLAEARRLGALSRRGFAETKRRANAPTHARIRETLADDLAGFAGL